jgi:hypothetical protein
MKKFIALFAVTYIGLISGAGFAVYYLAPQNHPTSINTIGILLSVTLVGFLFARQRKRVFTSTEYWTIVISCVVIDAALQFLVCLPLMFSDTPPARPLFPMFFLILGGHALLFAVGFSSRVVGRYVPAAPNTALEPTAAASSVSDAPSNPKAGGDSMSASSGGGSGHDR